MGIITNHHKNLPMKGIGIVTYWLTFSWHSGGHLSCRIRRWKIVPRAVADAAPTITGVFAPPKVVFWGEDEDAQETLNDYIKSYISKKLVGIFSLEVFFVNMTWKKPQTFH